ncbi:hypothetical protein N7463_009749 [Penicillium fimorum]|uniref:Uncharacterized protein n=1 Tax=Penicillium fimorum TaxID=1882269 RepID=A0A9W9XIL2_9EURO|nr:hypothetical protein N7463_009749 [Penicillium fimorum]
MSSPETFFIYGHNISLSHLHPLGIYFTTEQRNPISVEFAEMSETAAANVKTRFLVFSNTHEVNSPPDFVSGQYEDVVIHCGDLTTESKIDEYKASIGFLQALKAPLQTCFQRKVAEAQHLDPQLVQKVYGNYKEA